MHSVILHYKGYTVIVENYLYKLKISPFNKYLTFQDIKNVIDGIEDERFNQENKTVNENNRTEGIKT